jgi:hypothetical protein
MPRYECDDPAFAGNFIEYSDAWSLREVDAAWNAPPSAMVEAVAHKVTALHLEMLDGDPLMEPCDLTDDNLQGVDLRLYYWLAGTFVKVTTDIGQLGKALRRTLFASSAETTDGAPPAA